MGWQAHIEAWEINQLGEVIRKFYAVAIFFL